MNKTSAREGRTLEYKEKVSDFKSIARTVVAFSNDLGGRIIIGIDDKSRKTVGIPQDELERLLETLPQAIFDSITPACRPVIMPKVQAGKYVIEILVFPGSQKPYFISSQGLSEGTYIRAGAHTKRADEVLVKELINETERRYYDEQQLADATLEDLARSTLQEVYQTSTPATEQLLADKVLVRSAVTGSILVSVAGIVFFAKRPNQFLPNCELLYTQFAGKTLDAIVKTLDISAPLPEIVRTTLAEVLPRLSRKQKMVNHKLSTTQYEIPERALREALLNALIHRRYNRTDAVKVALFEDRLEIFSPGNFPGLITDFRSGISHTRNPHIRQLARKAGFVEKRGLGFRLIFDECRNNNNPEPQIIEGDDFVKVVFYRTQLSTSQLSQDKLYDDKLDTTCQLPPHLTNLKDLQLMNTPLKTGLVMSRLKCSENTARARIIELVELGFLRKEGKGRATHYVWIK